ncbi:hypothetical protein [Actinokineospora enzanensis]|uniref:hypothetical protein n=1 Tax=Actinokineospora enzanensis TaxID=155975 RepID=UPI00037E783C|nr:hypothetical protein [Actinokineospora enzanensis]
MTRPRVTDTDSARIDTPATSHTRQQIGEEPQPAVPVAFHSSWRYRNLQLRIAILLPAPTLALAVSTVVTGAVFAWGAVIAWSYLDVLAWRQWWRLPAATAASTLRSTGVGLGVFLLGAVFIVLDTLFHTRR